MRHRRSTLLVLLTGLALAAPHTASAAAAGGELSGTLRLQGGGTVVDACVELLGPVDRTVTTSADGTWRAGDLPAGEYLVGFNTCDQAVPYAAGEFWDDVASPFDAELVEVTAGSRQVLDAVLERAAHLSGWVTEAGSGAAVAGACVSAWEPDLAVERTTRTGSSGRYNLTALPAGTWELEVQDCTPSFFHGTVELGPVTVVAGQLRDGLDAALPLGGEIRGSVQGLHVMAPLSGICVALYAAGDRSAPLQVETTGASTNPAVRADQYLFAGVAPGRYDLVSDPALCGDDGWAVSVRSSVEVRAGQPAVGIGVVSPAPSTLVACGPPDPARRPQFTDVPSGVHRAAVECLADEGVVQGRAADRFDPVAAVRRDQMASFLARALEALGVELPAAPPNAFTDDEGNVHERRIDQLAALGVVSGRADGRYLPEAPVSRGQTATLLVNAYERATGYVLQPRGGFRDDAGTHQTAIRKAAVAGLAAGVGDGRFDPGASVRRDQTATFVARTIDRVLRDEPVLLD